jgi:hypothetical protein
MSNLLAAISSAGRVGEPKPGECALLSFQGREK